MSDVEQKQTILVVDDEPNNIRLLSEVLSKKYNVRVALNGKEALERCVSRPVVDLILLDIMMPGTDGYEVCRALKSKKKTMNIPVIFVTAKNEIADETLGFEVGAVDFITKPISVPIVLARISAHLSLSNQKLECEKTVSRKTSELRLIQNASIHMLGEAGHYNDNDTGIHIWRMASYAREIAQLAGWPVKKAEMLELAATMHDTGKIGIPDSILKAPRKLSNEEWDIMRSHTEIGYSILSKSDTALFQMAASIALSHHEKWDGSGYPKGLRDNKIPEAAAITAIADVFDALTMKRVYKNQWSVEEAFDEIEKSSGSHFSPVHAKLFLDNRSTIMELKEKWDHTCSQVLLDRNEIEQL